jgi:hypothetical protein
LTVIDAVRIMTVNDPRGGSLSYVKKLDTVFASTAMGLGRSNLGYLRIEQV